MLPPVDQDIRTANPKFDALYNDLCNNKLNPDGSTKLDSKAQRERDTLNEVCRIYSSEIISRTSYAFYPYNGTHGNAIVFERYVQKLIPR